MRSRDGFSLVEITTALLILAVGILGLQAATAKMIQHVSGSTRETVAYQLVEDRLAAVQISPVYSEISSRFQGTEQNVGGRKGVHRTTVVQHVRDSTNLGIIDYRRVTVSVTAPGLKVPASRTIAVGMP